MNLVAKVNEMATALSAFPFFTNFLTTSINEWKEKGEKIFILSPELVLAFQHTDIPMTIKAGDFKYPFPSFMIESNIPLFTTNSMGEERPIYNIIHKYEIGVNWNRTLVGFIHSKMNVIDYLRIYLNDNLTIEEDSEKRINGQGMMEESVTITDFQNMNNIFFNTIMYINDPNRSIKETEVHGTRLASNGKGKGSKMQQYILLRPPMSYKPLKSTGRIIDKRFVVRGHWRNQACGEKHQEHKKIWIYPFYKGPEFAEKINKPYVLK